jgi:hypothetical protein
MQLETFGTRLLAASTSISRTTGRTLAISSSMDSEILTTFSSGSCSSLQLETCGALLLTAHRRTGLAVCSLAVASGVHSEILGALKLAISLSSK